jgi:DNA-binding NtrC family response regulator
MEPLELKHKEIFRVDSKDDLANNETVGLQIGVLRDVAMTLLNELELLRPPVREESASELNFNDQVRRFETELILKALCSTHGNQLRASKILGIKPTTLNSKIKRYKIGFPFFSDASVMSRVVKL